MLIKKELEFSNHQRNMEVLMTEIYKRKNGIALTIMNSLFELAHVV